VQFSVLGPLEVHDDAAPVTLPGTKPRKLLARLLVDADTVVSIDALTDALWADDGTLPEKPGPTIQVYVSNLRRVLGPSVIRTAAPGYVVDLDGHACDARLLADLVANARTLRTEGHLDGAIAAARRATTLSRGEPYADFAYEDWAQAAVRELTELTLSAHEELHAALLAARREAETIAPLEALVSIHPFRERLRWLLMLALYRCGRQADALRTYSAGREAMIDALGVEPGSELQQLEARILDHDPDLIPQGPNPVRQPVIVAPLGSGLVGRTREQKTISQILTHASLGSAQLIVLEGDAGVGKSALGYWATEYASAQGFVSATGRAQDLAGAPPFWPWIKPLTALGIEDALAPTSDSPFLLYASVAERVATETREKPMVAVLDDMQWADEASIDLLKFLVRAPDSSRIAILALHRAVAADHPIALLEADLATERNVTRLTLGGLGGDDVAALVAGMIRTPVDRALTDAITERSGGNPFFVEELVRVMDTGDGALDVHAASVPRTVAELVRRRAATLSGDAVAILTAASFLSGTFSTQLIAALAGQPENAVRAVFDASVDDGLLKDEPGRAGWRRFAHELIRHSFYDPVAPETRAETHLRVAHLMVEHLGDGSDAAASEIAAHFAQAASVGGAESAVRWARVAAGRAISAVAYADAVRQLRRALFVTRRELRDPALECDVLLDLASAARLGADQWTAVRATERASVLARRLGDPMRQERVQSPMLRARRDD
jgi:DNA-binding SARP family transcriptional activator